MEQWEVKVEDVQHTSCAAMTYLKGYIGIQNNFWNRERSCLILGILPVEKGGEEGAEVGKEPLYS